jgi:hypothetical protein
VTEPVKKRRSRVLEVLQQQQEEREAAQAESGDEQPFPDLAAELGLEKPQADGGE